VNTRTKDLVDLVLLIERGRLKPDEVQEALHPTFLRRNTHPLPVDSSPPPESWRIDFPPMAVEARLSTEVVQEAFAILTTYWSANQLGAMR